MRFLLVLTLALNLALSLGAQNKLTKEEKKDGFQLLFDGKTLKGWEGEKDLWTVVNGEIFGSTEKRKIKTNTFLISTKEYSDFELRLDMKLRNHNSGVQIRSEKLPDFAMKGLQADAENGKWWGGFYDEKGTRGIMVRAYDKAKTVLKEGDWNSIVIRCKGEDVSVSINGLETAAVKEPKPSGLIGFQMHVGPPMEVHFRNIRLKDLSKK